MSGAGQFAAVGWSPAVRRMVWGLSVAGVVALPLGLAWVGARTWVSWLLASQYLIQVGVSGAVLVALLYASGATWGVAFRRVPESLCALLPIGAAGFMLLLLVHPAVYPWIHDPVGGPFKRWWLAWPFFTGRAAAYLAAWIGLTTLMLRVSRRQDVTGDLADSALNTRLAALFLGVFAVTFSLSAFDWIMSLEPEWYSTIFAAQVFAGTLLAGLAATTVGVSVLQRAGPLRDTLTPSHLHDLGKLLFGMSTFWMYLWFSQYMLIWYANIPEEAIYYVRRFDGPLWPLVLLTVALNWIVPFVVLMPRRAKRHPPVMFAVAVTVLVGHWVDLHVMIVPSASDASLWPSVLDVAISLGAIGLAIGVVTHALNRSPIVPVGDPGLAESLHYHS